MRRKKRIILAELVVLLLLVVLAVGMIATRAKANESIETAELTEETLALKTAMEEARAKEIAALEKRDELNKEIEKAERKLILYGIKADDIVERAMAENIELARKEKEYQEAKANVAAELAEARNNYVNCGREFLNSRASTSIEYWTAKARASSSTRAAASTGLFASALNDALTYDHLMTASYQIDKSNSLGNVNRKIDYNLMTAAAVGAAVYASDHSLSHTYSRRVIGPNYGPWEDENLAYGMSTSQAWVIWYDNEAATNGPHFRNIRATGRTTTGYGYTVKGSPAPSHVQEFGVNGSGAKLTTTAQFRADLKQFRDDAKAAYEAAKTADVKYACESADLIQARLNLDIANRKLQRAGEKIGIDYPALVKKAAKAENRYQKKHKEYLKAKKAFDEAYAAEMGESIEE
ncbi:MAG: hypothetical protein PUD55_07155 [Firmicutes bacterium]|nr:hypothetical protein [Bacillota bacterium]